MLLEPGKEKYNNLLIIHSQSLQIKWTDCDDTTFFSISELQTILEPYIRQYLETSLAGFNDYTINYSYKTHIYINLKNLTNRNSFIKLISFSLWSTILKWYHYSNCIFCWFDNLESELVKLILLRRLDDDDRLACWTVELRDRGFVSRYKT